MTDYLNPTEWAHERVDEIVNDVRYYIAEGIPVDTALTMVHRETTLSAGYWARVVSEIKNTNEKTAANECSCESCQKHAPLFPWLIHPVERVRENGMGTPKALHVFATAGEAGYAKLTRYLIDYGYSPVTSLRVMTHEQVEQLYLGNGAI